MEDKPFRIIGLTGPKTCGKDTAGEGLVSLNRKHEATLFRIQKMAGPAKAIASLAFGYAPALNEDVVLKEEPLKTWPHICPRQLVIDVANWYRAQYTGEVWARAWERLARQANPEWGCHVITDVRFPEEIDMIRRNHGLLIYIERDEAEKSLAEKQAAGDVMANNVSESHYEYARAMANATVPNNDSQDALLNRITAVVRNGMGHWNYWPEIRDLHVNWVSHESLDRLVRAGHNQGVAV